MENEQIPLSSEFAPIQATAQAHGHALVFVAIEDRMIGALALEATLRPEAKAVAETLQAAGFALYIISGDQEAPTRQLAKSLGITHYFASVLPEHKADLVAQLQQAGQKVCFVSDGINDAVALRQANVSVSLRGATTAANDTAQVVLMNADLRQLHTLFTLARELDKNIAFNFKVATAFSLLSGGSILFLHLKYIAVEVLAASQWLTGVGIASKPLLAHQNKPLTGD
ncbi:MAG: HAD-IC family P-type ATPase [Caldilineaceae bacterium]